MTRPHMRSTFQVTRRSRRLREGCGRTDLSGRKNRRRMTETTLREARWKATVDQMQDVPLFAAQAKRGAPTRPRWRPHRTREGPRYQLVVVHFSTVQSQPRTRADLGRRATLMS